MLAVAVAVSAHAASLLRRILLPLLAMAFRRPCCPRCFWQWLLQHFFSSGVGEKDGKSHGYGLIVELWIDCGFRIVTGEDDERNRK